MGLVVWVNADVFFQVGVVGVHRAEHLVLERVRILLCAFSERFLGHKSRLRFVILLELLSQELVFLLVVSFHELNWHFLLLVVCQGFALCDPAHMNISYVRKPDVGVFISDELALHLQELAVSRALEVVADLETLLLAV